MGSPNPAPKTEAKTVPKVKVKFERVIEVEAQSETEALKIASKQFLSEVATRHELGLKVYVVLPSAPAPQYVA